MMKVNELKEKSKVNIELILNDLLREQFNLRMQIGSGQLARPDQVKKVRRDIARVKTVLNEIKRNEA